MQKNMIARNYDVLFHDVLLFNIKSINVSIGYASIQLIINFTILLIKFYHLQFKTHYNFM